MHPKLERVLICIRSGNIEAIDRWDVMNNVRPIIARLVELNLWTEEIENYLYSLHESAIDSL